MKSQVSLGELPKSVSVSTRNGHVLTAYLDEIMVEAGKESYQWIRDASANAYKSGQGFGPGAASEAEVIGHWYVFDTRYGYGDRPPASEKMVMKLLEQDDVFIEVNYTILTNDPSLPAGDHEWETYAQEAKVCQIDGLESEIEYEDSTDEYGVLSVCYTNA